jgi:hypothetical protein
MGLLNIKQAGSGEDGYDTVNLLLTNVEVLSKAKK